MPMNFEIVHTMFLYKILMFMKSYAFGNYIYPFSSVTLMYSLFGRHISFSLFMPINLNIIHTCVSICNINAYSVWSDSHKYYHLVAIFVVSHLWSLTNSLMERHIARNLHFICMCAIHTHSCSSAYIHPSMHTYMSVHTHSAPPIMK